MNEDERFGDVNEPEEDRQELTSEEGTTRYDEEFPLIAKTMAELEDVLAEELIGLGANNVEIGTRMVSFTGNKALMYKANLHCRTALRILKPIYNFKAETANEVYEAIKELNWDDYLTLDTTFSIDAVVFSHIFTHSKFVAYKVKDAIADWFSERYGKRPSVSLTNPDVVLNIHVSHNKCTLSLDSSGESLHKRGYRVGQTEAPLSEVLAAGMILKSGWKGDTTFIDPMCGSGTILIEAAMIAMGIPPGIHRPHFAFEKWNDFDEELFSNIYNDDSGTRELKHRIIGSDISPQAIAIAEKNIKNAGLKKQIELSVKPFQQYTEAPDSEGVLITNPPYGERLKVEELEGLYAMIGERLKHVFLGFNAYILSYRKESFDAIGLKHNRRFFLYNGALECEMREYEIFSGKRRERPKEEAGREPRRGHDYQAERNSKEGYRRSKRAERDEEGETDFGRQARQERSGNRQERPGNRQERSERRGERPERRGERSERGERPERTGERSFKTERRPYEKRGEPGERHNADSRHTGERPFSKERSPRERNSERGAKPGGFRPDKEREQKGRSFDARSKDRGGFSREDHKPRDFKKRTPGRLGDATSGDSDRRKSADGEGKEPRLRRPRMGE
jgi:putative N6-adenine-specific DNA methylase